MPSCCILYSTGVSWITEWYGLPDEQIWNPIHTAVITVHHHLRRHVCVYAVLRRQTMQGIGMEMNVMDSRTFSSPFPLICFLRSSARLSHKCTVQSSWWVQCLSAVADSSKSWRRNERWQRFERRPAGLWLAALAWI